MLGVIVGLKTTGCNLMNAEVWKVETQCMSWQIFVNTMATKSNMSGHEIT